MRSLARVLLVLASLAVPAAAQAADSYVDLTKISQDPGFQQRVAYAMCSAAIAISNEGSSVAMHAARIAYAKQVAAGSYNLQEAALAVLAVSPVNGEASFAAGTPGFSVPDGDIATAVSAVWNWLAGAYN